MLKNLYEYFSFSAFDFLVSDTVGVFCDIIRGWGTCETLDGKLDHLFCFFGLADEVVAEDAGVPVCAVEAFLFQDEVIGC